MIVKSVALGASYSAVLSLLGLNTNGPIGIGLTVGELSSDTFVLWGTLDSAATTNANAENLGSFYGGAAQNLLAGIADAARTWPYVLVQRTAGSTAGSFLAVGDAAASPAVVSTAAPVVVGAYSSLMTLTTLSAQYVRIGGSSAMLSTDVFDVYLTNDSAATTSTGCFYAGQITGGNSNAGRSISKLFSGYAYALVRRASSSTTLTAGTILAASVAPASGGGTLNLTTLVIGDTAVTGPIGALTAAQTVDTYSSLLTAQTTAGPVVVTLPTPTDTTPGKTVQVMNNDTSTQPILMYGQLLGPGSMQVFEWDGSAWLGGRNITAGGNALGSTLVIGTLDAASFRLQANSAVWAASNGIVTNIGGNAGAEQVVILTGTAGADIATGASDHPVNIGSVTGASATTIKAGTSGLALGVDAIDHPVRVGSTTGASLTTIQGGTSGIAITPTGAGPVTTTGSEIGVAPAAIADRTGSLGTAAATVDLTSTLLVNQTTAVVLYANMRTIPLPTTLTIGRRLKIVNVGTAAFIVGDVTQKQGVNLIPGTTPGGAASANKGQSCDFVFNGTAWVPDDTGPGAPVVAAGLADADASIPRAGRYTVYRMATLATRT